MNESGPDSEPITPEDHNDDPESRLLRRYRLERRRGDDEAAIELWEQLVLRHYDLMRTKIARLATRGDFKWITTDEVDDVAQEAYARANTMALRFEQDTIGQLRAALIKTALHTALDYQRRLDVRKRDVAGSLDDTRSLRRRRRVQPVGGGGRHRRRLDQRAGARPHRRAAHPRRDREDPERQPARRDRPDLGRV